METLDQWFADNAKKIDLQIRVFDNDLLSSLQVSDIDSKILVNGQSYWGRGTDRDIHAAIRKSCSEAVERFFLRKNKIATSNGFAVHTTKALALDSARKELIERDLFFCHFLTQTPFKSISIENPWIIDSSKKLKDAGVDVSFYSMGSLNSTEGILCAIYGAAAQNPFGYIFGTAAGLLTAAIESAFLEALRNYAHFDKGTVISLEDFNRKANVGTSFIDHGNLALDISYAKKALDPLFVPGGISVEENFELHFTSHFFNLEGTPFDGAPLSVCRATSIQLQDIGVGVLKAEKLNETRLKQFCIAYSTSFQVTNLPHPFN